MFAAVGAVGSINPEGALVLKRFGNGPMGNYYARALRRAGVEWGDYMRGLRAASDRQIRAALRVAAKGRGRKD